MKSQLLHSAKVQVSALLASMFIFVAGITPAQADVTCIRVANKNGKAKVSTVSVVGTACPKKFKKIFDTEELGTLFTKTGPQGATGPQGPAGPKGEMGVPGLPADVSVRVSRSTAQTIASGIFVEVGFDTVLWDTAAAFSLGSPTRLVIPEDGKYLVYATLPWASNLTGIRRASIHRNGDFNPLAVSRNVGAGGAIGTVHSISTHFQLNAGDFLTLEVFQTSGANLNVIEPQPASNKVSGAEFGFVKLP